MTECCNELSRERDSEQFDDGETHCTRVETHESILNRRAPLERFRLQGSVVRTQASVSIPNSARAVNDRVHTDLKNVSEVDHLGGTNVGVLQPLGERVATLLDDEKNVSAVIKLFWQYWCFTTNAPRTPPHQFCSLSLSITR